MDVLVKKKQKKSEKTSHGVYYWMFREEKAKKVRNSQPWSLLLDVLVKKKRKKSERVSCEA